MKFEQIVFLNTLPNDFSELKNMKSLSFVDAGINSYPLGGICNMLNLETLEITRGGFKTLITIPKCITNLKLLKVFIIDSSGIEDIPLGLFNLPNLLNLVYLMDLLVGIKY